MSDSTFCTRSCPDASASYCLSCDRLVGLEGLHVIAVDLDEGSLVVTVESPPGPAGCRGCGVVATSHGRREHALVDVPAFGRPVHLVWRKRTWTCGEPSCEVRSSTEVDEDLALPRARLSTRARWWAIGQLRREHASVAGVARRLGVSWRTLWSSVAPLLAVMAADETRFEGVAALGVDEHVWHHVSVKERGPKELTGMST